MAEEVTLISVGATDSIMVESGGMVWTRLEVIGTPSDLWYERFSHLAPDSIQLVSIEDQLVFNLHAHPSDYPSVLDLLRAIVADCNNTTFNLDDRNAVVNTHIKNWRARR